MNTQATEPLRTQIWALAQALKSHGYRVEVAESEPLMTVPSAFGSPVVVRCDPRTACNGEPWFFFAGGGAIAPADDDHLMDVVVVVKGKMVSQADA